ncbi:hypothetical protein [Spongiivirga citrea]|uniref:Uncharacterized protein n=1 Tax=Spongiivirga citrea TaxID=1481457 RepID=A0A6M0CFG2_9FLAO|nr:hypothetical protein [Spongiivirga citrea]NER16162.1 hypothetical protein [Spongiivirga citrea]
MKLSKFIFKLTGLLIILLALYFCCSYFIIDRYVDRYYHKFRYPAGSMVVGLSRSNFGISPEVLDQEFGDDEIAKPVLNFSFELYRSPYGSVYKKDIENKIAEGTTNGVFIVSVSPGSFLIPINSSEDDVDKLDEDTMLGKMDYVNVDPNFEYMVKCYANPLYKGIVFWPKNDVVVTHDNGWIEFREGTSTYEITEKMVDKWSEETLISYKKILVGQKISIARLKAFEDTVLMLKEYGKVYVVRTPVLKDVLDFETEFWPEMNSQIDSIANKVNVPYWDYTKDHSSYTYYDGSHLFSKSAEMFTRQLAMDIKKK